MKTQRERQEHMLHFVCGIDFDALKEMTDTEVNKLYLKYLKNM